MISEGGRYRLQDTSSAKAVRTVKIDTAEQVVLIGDDSSILRMEETILAL